MSDYIIIVGYFLWKYYYVLEYGYNIFYYMNVVRHLVFDKKEEKDSSEDWLLCEEKDPFVIIEKL
jgi:hypothetical protein